MADWVGDGGGVGLDSSASLGDWSQMLFDVPFISRPLAFKNSKLFSSASELL